ncbi:MAG: DedA family protein [Candidatus Micrarchaeaceae archaeon]
MLANVLLFGFSLSNYYASFYTLITNFFHSYGYFAVFSLMMLESATIPIPSEVVMPLAGIFAARHIFGFYPALAASVLGSAAGIAIDYYIGYYIGKDIVYKHLRLFRIKKEQLDAFDVWFERNGIAAVFLTRLVPVIRTVMSFPAGFAKMKPKEFFAYSISGALIWNAVLMSFGFYALSGNSAVDILAAIGVFVLLLYIVYALAIKRLRRKH